MKISDLIKIMFFKRIFELLRSIYLNLILYYRKICYRLESVKSLLYRLGHIGPSKIRQKL